ncbi:hypothetical protein TNIN_146791 [Trichonephila inaurata madagascariensis]|uniref:Uncharacterized protein n=1 Tax=Trichonephila inaurata madagascariensis TaxID=2747483 RepID=A0A8X6Y107_9ARAC|nr:hypothetical protein TNIN_146791 [Trichonephila inaurata madagascariensis]
MSTQHDFTIPHRLFRKSEAVRCDLHVISDAPSLAKHKQLVDTLLFRAQIESEDNPRVTRLPTPRIPPAICLNGRLRESEKIYPFAHMTCISEILALSLSSQPHRPPDHPIVGHHAHDVTPNL